MNRGLPTEIYLIGFVFTFRHLIAVQKELGYVLRFPFFRVK